MTKEEIQAVIDRGGWIIYPRIASIFKPTKLDVTVFGDIGVWAGEEWSFNNGKMELEGQLYNCIWEMREATEEEIKCYTT